MARRVKGGKGRKQRRGGFLSLILSAIASGALAAAAGEGVKAVIDATKRHPQPNVIHRPNYVIKRHPPGPVVVRARGLKHKVGLKSSHRIESGLNVGAYPLITRPVSDDFIMT